MRWRRFCFGFAIYAMGNLALNPNHETLPRGWRILFAVGALALLWYGASGWSDK